jgi:S1-C subfamily serine protease
MNRPFWLLLPCLGILSIGLFVQADRIGGIANRPLAMQISLNQLEAQARFITVKILSGEALGSGILISQQDSVYTVLTNDHVLPMVESFYQVQTFDRNLHEAKLIKRAASLEGNDLAILQFQSTDQYQVAQIGNTPKDEEQVFAAGFPLPAGKSKEIGFVVRPGEVRWVLDKALEGGYQVGYSSEVEKGMSGGPLLNGAGQVVSINGWHAHPIWGDPYIYQDGSEPSPEDREKMSQYSWAIPIDTFLRSASPESNTQESQ